MSKGPKSRDWTELYYYRDASNLSHRTAADYIKNVTYLKFQKFVIAFKKGYYHPFLRIHCVFFILHFYSIP